MCVSDRSFVVIKFPWKDSQSIRSVEPPPRKSQENAAVTTAHDTIAGRCAPCLRCRKRCCSPRIQKDFWCVAKIFHFGDNGPFRPVLLCAEPLIGR